MSLTLKEDSPFYKEFLQGIGNNTQGGGKGTLEKGFLIGYVQISGRTWSRQYVSSRVGLRIRKS